VGKKSKKRKLDALAASLQRRYGPRALGRTRKPATGKPDFPHISTGFPVLDRALGIGGLPRGRITECIGAYTSGKTTVILKAVAQATAAGDVVAVIDLERTFNPDYARRAGVDLSRVLLPPAEDPLQALEITRYLVTEQGIGMIVFNDVANLIGHDRAAKWLSATLRQITGALHQSCCALIFLTTPASAQVSPKDYPSGFAPSTGPSTGSGGASGRGMPHYAAIRLGFEMTQPLRRRDGARGFRVQATVLKNKLAPPARKPVTFDIYFNGAVESNGIM